MKAFLKGLALWVLVTSVVWIAVLWRWQATRHDVSGQDLLTYLVVLPLVVFGLLLALRWAVRGALAKEAAVAAAQTPAAADAATTSVATGTAPAEAQNGTGALAWPVFGAWVTSAAGSDSAGMLDAAKAGKPRPAPDKTLRNQQGMPVICARVNTLDIAQVRRAWERWQQQAQQAATALPTASATAIAPAPATATATATTTATATATDLARSADRGNGSAVALAEPEHVWRALGALDELLPEALLKADERVAGLFAETGKAVRVRVVPIWPAGWSGVETAGANRWLDRQLRHLLPGRGPDEATGGGPAWVVEATPPQSGPQAWLQVDELLMTLERQQRDDVVVMMSCHSDLGDVPVRALEVRDRLYDTDSRPAGRMPGEGAAVLMLGRAGQHRAGAHPGTAKSLAADSTQDAVAWLHRPHGMSRETSVERSGKVSSEVARRVARQAIDAARIAAADVGGLCCDGDQHSSRSTELWGTTIELLPDLDVIDDVRLLGVATGHAAQTGAMWAVAGAIELARSTQRPALALSLADEHWRMAAVVRPHAPPPGPDPA